MNHTYQTPQAELQPDAALTDYGDLKLFNASLRLGRLRYLLRGMLFMIGIYCAIFVMIFGGIFLASVSSAGAIFSLASGPVAIGVIGVLLVAAIFSGIQRLHDLDKTGWLILLLYIPLVGIVFGLYMLFTAGTQGVNRYGAPPPPNKTWHTVVAIGVGVVFLVLIVILTTFSQAFMMLTGTGAY